MSPPRCQRRTLLQALALGALPWRSVPAQAGIPASSLSRLIRLQDALADLDPGQLALAVLLDARIEPGPQAVPVLTLRVHPLSPGGFLPIDERLEMTRFSPATLPAGLEAAAGQLRWLLFVLDAPAQARFRRAQGRMRELAAEHRHGSEAQANLSIGPQALLPHDPGLAQSHWETWLRSDRREGFYPVWTGTVQELAEESRALP